MTEYASAREVRDWANAKQPGTVRHTGHFPRFVILAWNRAHPDRPYVEGKGWHGSVTGYTAKGCRCEPCTEAARAYWRARYLNARDERDDDLADALLDGGVQ